MPAGDLITAVTATFGVQYEWAGVLMGTNTKLIVDEVDGLDSMPELAASDIDRNDDHGTILGLDLLKSRDVTISLKVNGDSQADIIAIYRTLARVMRPIQATPPLVFQRPGEPKKQVFARPRKRDFPSNSDVALGLAKGKMNWLCPDPRIYSLVENHVQLIVPAGTQAGQIVVHNSGDFHTWPRFVLSGSGQNPRIAVSGQTADPLDGTSYNGRTTAMDLVMAGGDSLAINPKLKTVSLNGANVYGVRRSDNQWWELMPGDNTVQLSRSVYNSQQTLDIYWYDAWI